MIFLKFNIFSIILCILFSNSPIFGMKKFEKTKNKSPEINAKTEVITEPNIFSDVLLPFVEKQSDLMTLRRVGKTMKQGIVIHSEEFRPIKLKPIFPRNITSFLKWLKNNHEGIDFAVSISIDAKNPKTKNILAGLENKNINSKDFEKILDLIGNRIKDLTLSNFDCKLIDLSKLKKCFIRKLTLIHCKNIDDKFLTFLPKNLKELDILNSYNDFTGKTFINMPKTLNTIKIGSIQNVEKKLLDSLPKSISTIYITDLIDILFFDDLKLNDQETQEKIIHLKNKGISVLDSNGDVFPTTEEELKPYIKKITQKKDAKLKAINDNLEI